MVDLARLSIVILVLAAPAANPAAAAGIEGLWRTATDNGEVRIEPCGQAICGRLITSDRLKAFPGQLDVRNHDKAARGRPLKGALIAKGFSGGPVEWSGGTLYDPAGGGTYSGRLRLTNTDTLRLTGCIVAPLCRSQTWTRIAPTKVMPPPA